MKRSIAVFLSALFLCLFITGSVSAADANEAADIAEGIIAYKLKSENVDSVQSLIEGPLAEKAGASSEWYAIALSQWGEYDFSAYTKALSRYISDKEIRSATTREKYALAFIAGGYEHPFIAEALENSPGEQGIMSYIYGLHIINNGYTSEKNTAKKLIDEIIALINPDGGWSINGEISDVDVTAMTLQALAPYCDNDEKLKEIAENAVDLLSKRQLENGDFSSYGVPNCESTAQVIIALSALGITAEDERFIKNGNNLFNGIKGYMLPDGSFSHEKEKEFSDLATVQAFSACVAYERMLSGKTPFYVFDKHSVVEIIDEATEAEASENSTITEVIEPSSETIHNQVSYKVYAVISVVALAVIIAIILTVLKKCNRKNLLFLALLASLGIVFVLVTNFSSAEDYYGEATIKNNPVGTVNITVSCEKILGKTNADYVPENGIIISDSFAFEEGETVFDILVEAAKKHGIQLEFTGSPQMAYVAGINYLYEFDFGDLSGWVYHVNGISPSVSCGEYKLSDGDKIDWYYTLDLGNDIEQVNNEGL